MNKKEKSSSISKTFYGHRVVRFYQKYNTLAQTPSSSLEISGGPVLTRKVAIQTWIYTRTRKLAKNAFVLNQFSRWSLDQDLNFG